MLLLRLCKHIKMLVVNNRFYRYQILGKPIIEKWSHPDTTFSLKLFKRFGVIEHILRTQVYISHILNVNQSDINRSVDVWSKAWLHIWIGAWWSRRYSIRYQILHLKICIIILWFIVKCSTRKLIIDQLYPTYFAIPIWHCI